MMPPATLRIAWSAKSAMNTSCEASTATSVGSVSGALVGTAPSLQVPPPQGAPVPANVLTLPPNSCRISLSELSAMYTIVPSTASPVGALRSADVAGPSLQLGAAEHAVPLPATVDTVDPLSSRISLSAVSPMYRSPPASSARPVGPLSCADVAGPSWQFGAVVHCVPLPATTEIAPAGVISRTTLAAVSATYTSPAPSTRSEERRVGKECRPQC